MGFFSSIATSVTDRFPITRIVAARVGLLPLTEAAQLALEVGATEKRIRAEREAEEIAKRDREEAPLLAELDKTLSKIDPDKLISVLRDNQVPAVLVAFGGFYQLEWPHSVDSDDTITPRFIDLVEGLPAFQQIKKIVSAKDYKMHMVSQGIDHISGRQFPEIAFAFSVQKYDAKTKDYPGIVLAEEIAKHNLADETVAATRPVKLRGFIYHLSCEDD